MSRRTPIPRRVGKVARVLIYLLTAFILITLLLYQTGPLKPRPKVAIVTASSGPYWDSIVHGATDAAQRYNLNLTVLRPRSDEPSQTEAIRSLLGKGYVGVAVSPNDPLRQAAVLAEVATASKLVTYDSDCPVAGKITFIGSDNYDAGRLAGMHIEQAVPEGGEVIISIGSLDKENGQRRRQGVIDELLQRTTEPHRPMDPIDQPPLKEKGKYTIVTTLVDGIDPAKATALAVDAIKQHPDVKCFACLFAYSTPSVLKALEQAGKLGKIQVVGFDTNDQTLAGIDNGNVYATIMQSPYNIGFESVRVLADIARGESQNLPMFSTFYLSCDPVTKANLAGVRENLARKERPPAAAAPPSAASPEASPASQPAAAARG
jgi:ribose transport system substrate-binding protein